MKSTKYIKGNKKHKFIKNKLTYFGNKDDNKHSGNINTTNQATVLDIAVILSIT